MSDNNLESYNGSSSTIPSPMAEPAPAQYLGWASPTAPNFPEVYHGGARDVLSAPGFSVAGQHAGPSDQALVLLENARLKALVSNMSTRIGNLTSALAATTPKPTQTTPPRKRTAPREEDNGASPSKCACPATPTPSRIMPGPIEAMWSPGVTPEQRRAMYDRGIGLSTPTSVPASSPTANFKTSFPPQGKFAPKKPRAPAHKKATATKKAPKTTKKQQKSTGSTSSFDPIGIDLRNVDIAAFSVPQERPEDQRPIQELYSANFMSLPLSDKARLLLPLLRGVDPATGQKFSEPGTLGLQIQAPKASTLTPAPTTDPNVEQSALLNDPAFDAWLLTLQPQNSEPVAAPEPQADVLDATAVNSLMSYISEDTATSSDHGSSPGSPVVSSPASSAHAIDATSSGDGGLLTELNDVENTTGDISEALNGDAFLEFLTQDLTRDDPQVLTGAAFDELLKEIAQPTAQDFTGNDSQALAGNTFDGFLATTSSASSDAQSPNGDNSQALIENPFGNDFFSGNGNTFSSNGLDGFGTFPLIDFSTGFCDFDLDQFPEETKTTPTDLDAGLQMAQDATKFIGSPDDGAKRQREALEEHERRVAEGRRR